MTLRLTFPALIMASLLSPSGAQTVETVPNHLPLAFIENQGQWSMEYRYRLGRGPISAVLLSNGFALQLIDPVAARLNQKRAAGLRFEFESEVDCSGPIGRERASGYYNFFVGEEESLWRSHVPAWQQIEYRDVWHGIDVVLHEGEGLFEYDLLVAPGADLSTASIRISGANSMRIDNAGCLAIETEAGLLLQSAPIAWTVDASGSKENYPCNFRLLAEDRFGFEGPPVPIDQRLVVDPGLIWSTYLGDEDEDITEALAIVPGGDVLATGSTNSFDFPVTVGAYDMGWSGPDAFISRISADGSSLVYSTFIGGAGAERGTALAVHSDGSVYLTGETSSADFPATSAAYDQSLGGFYDGFILHLDSSGSSLLQASFLGGSGLERVTDCALDPNGMPVLCGSTAGSGFPTFFGSYDSTFSGGVNDGFVTRFSADLASLDFSTYFGGGGTERVECLEVASDGLISIAGWTSSTNFPTTSGALLGNLSGGSGDEDGFVARLDAFGQSLVFSTYLGGTQSDRANAMALTSTGDCVVVGETQSSDFVLGSTPGQSTNGGQKDGFVTHLSSTGGATQIVTSSYFGGSMDDRCDSIARLPGDQFAVAGTTGSNDLVMEPWVYDRIYSKAPWGGVSDLFINRYEADGSLNYSTYFGGNVDDVGTDLISDEQGGVVFCGYTNSLGFPLTGGAFDTSYDYSGLTDGFVSHFEFVRFPFNYGEPKINSIGSWAQLSSSGFPSLAENNFTIWGDGAMSNTQGLIFYSSGSAAAPFLGGELLLSPPLQRTPVQSIGWLGGASLAVDIDASMVGTKRFYQFWYLDPNDAFGVGLSDALEVFFYP
ncbi:MAG: hypothetical protein ACI8X5_003455 [Planctomycetota bacterium]|jgi:hypothetical protein